MYGKKIETLDDLQNSDVVYGYNPALDYSRGILGYPEIIDFIEHKTLKEECSDVWKCAERMITKRDIAGIGDQVFCSYVAMEMGTVDVGKIICPFEGNFMSLGLIVVFKKGNPLLDRFNILMRRYLEAGLMERLWTELQHRASLRGGKKLREADVDEFFPFSVSHLMPAFVVLIVGTLLSSVVFIGELIVNCLCKWRGKKISDIRRVREL
jgi:hypothetical protein